MRKVNKDIVYIVTADHDPVWFDPNSKKVYIDSDLEEELPPEEWWEDLKKSCSLMDCEDGKMKKKRGRKRKYQAEETGAGAEEDVPIIISGNVVELNPPKELAEQLKDVI